MVHRLGAPLGPILPFPRIDLIRDRPVLRSASVLISTGGCTRPAVAPGVQALSDRLRLLSDRPKSP